MPNISPSHPTPDTPDAKLCLACGMCCNGVLHPTARLAPQEISFADSLGMTTSYTPGNAHFHLPCPCWQEERCSVYPLRPNVCHTYRCKLLRSLDRQTITLDVALEHLQQVQTLIQEIEAMIGDSRTADSIWTRLRRFAAQRGYTHDSAQFGQDFPLLKLKASSLDWLLQRHFRQPKTE